MLVGSVCKRPTHDVDYKPKTWFKHGVDLKRANDTHMPLGNDPCIASNTSEEGNSARHDHAYYRNVPLPSSLMRPPASERTLRSISPKFSKSRL